MPNLTGKILRERYRLGALLGEGGMGAVYDAIDVTLDRPVAVKVMHEPPQGMSDAARKRFQREAREIARLVHPSIVSVTDVYLPEDSGDVPFMVMERLDGETLEARLERDGTLDERTLVDIGVQIGSALEAAHRGGLVHRDVKPANIFLVRVAGAAQAKLLDFGIARAFQATTTLTAAGAILGSPLYMAPEQANGEAIGPWTDVYGLGATLFRARFGEPPVRGDSFAAIAVQLASPREYVVTDADTRLAQVILEAVRKKPSERYAAASDLVAALERAAPTDLRIVPAARIEPSARVVPAARMVPSARVAHAAPETPETPALDDTLIAPPPETPRPPPSYRNRLTVDDAPPRTGRTIALALGATALLGGAAVLVMANAHQSGDDEERAHTLASRDAAPTADARTVGAIPTALPGMNEPPTFDLGASVDEVRFSPEYAGRTCARLSSGEIWCWNIDDAEITPYRVPRLSLAAGERVTSFENQARYVFVSGTCASGPISHAWAPTEFARDTAHARSWAKQTPFELPVRVLQGVACTTMHACFVRGDGALYAAVYDESLVPVDPPRALPPGTQIDALCPMREDAVVAAGGKLWLGVAYLDGRYTRVGWRPIAGISGVKRLACTDANVVDFTGESGTLSLAFDRAYRESIHSAEAPLPLEWKEEAPLKLQSGPSARTHAEDQWRCAIEHGRVTCSKEVRANPRSTNGPRNPELEALAEQAVPIEGYLPRKVWNSQHSLCVVYERTGHGPRPWYLRCGRAPLTRGEPVTNARLDARFLRDVPL